MTDLFLLITLILNVGGVVYFARNFYFNHFSWYSFALFCYALMFLGGYSLISIFDHYYGYKMPIWNLDLIYVDSLVGLFLMILSGLVLRKKKVNISSPMFVNVYGEVRALKILGVLSGTAIFTYIAANGLSIGAEDYSYRYDTSRGWGGVILFFPAFLPVCCYYLFSAEGKVQYAKRAFFMLLIGLLTFIVMSGYRQIFIAVALSIGVIAIHKKYVSLSMFFYGIIAGLCFLVFLSFVRYLGDSGDTPLDFVETLFYYIQGDVFPIDAPLKIYEYYQGVNDNPGWDVFAAHFSKLIPRFIWSDKPMLLSNAAGYYTMEVAEYARSVTLSPTVMGEAYLIGGRVYFYLIMLFAGVTLRFVDIMLEKTKSQLVFFSLLSFQYAGFFFVREGVSELLMRIFVISIFIGIGIVCCRVRLNAS